MKHVIIIKAENGGVFLYYPNKEKIDYSKDNIFKHPRVQGKEWFVMNHADFLKVHQDPEKETRDQYYCDGNTLKIDKSWSILLMPISLIKKRHLSRLNKKLDEELDKENPNSILLTKLHREKEKCNSWDESQWYAQARKYILEENISKPNILEKIENKLRELAKESVLEKVS